MSDVAERLKVQRTETHRELEKLANSAGVAGRYFTDSEQQRYDELTDRLGDLDQRIADACAPERRNAEIATSYARLEQSSMPGTYGRGRDDELRSWIRGEGPRIFELQPEALNIRAMQIAVLENRSLFSGSGSGANTVPSSFHSRLVEHLIATAAVATVAQTISTSGGNDLAVPKTTAHSSASIVSEGSAIAVSDPTFGQVVLGSYKYGALIQVSRELLDDTGIDLEGYLARETGVALGNAFGAHLMVGSGTGQPRGVLTDTTVGSTGGSAAPPTYDNLVDLYHSVLPEYRRQTAFWVLNDNTLSEIRKLKSTQGVPLLVPSANSGEPDTLFGKRIVVDPNVPDVAALAKSVLFGDFSRYFVRLAGGLRFERSDDYAFDRDLVTYRALMRGDGALIDLTGAIKHYASA